jgi:monovalent cation/hydrogen antiporter
MSATITLIFALLVAIIALAAIATKIRMPYAIFLTLGGLLLGFIPGLPRVQLNPDLVMFLFLPPLIYSSAWFTSWREFRATLRPILQLSIGLVLVTTSVVAIVAHAVGLPWPVAFVLGALVSPTDAVAASATARSFGLARRVMTVIEGESIVNDATGLVIYRFAVAAVVTGAFSLGEASLQFMLVSLGGLLVGIVVGWPLAWVHRQLDDAPLEISITLLTPFAVYLLAETLHVSGVLAALATGLYLSRQSARFFSSNTRLQANAVWEVLIFLLNGFVFLLIGLQLHGLLDTVASSSALGLLVDAVVVCLTVVLIRIICVFAVTYLPFLLSARTRARNPYPDWRNVMIIAWTGMRGGVSLAAALALPLTIANGQTFPARDLAIFLTFCVIIVTLVLQGLSLMPLIRWLRPERDTSLEQEHAQAHITAAHAALERLGELATEDDMPEEYLNRLRSHYEKKIKLLKARNDGEKDEQHENRVMAKQRLYQEALTAERTAIIKLRDQGHIDDEAMRVVERELDLEEQRLRGDW